MGAGPRRGRTGTEGRNGKTGEPAADDTPSARRAIPWGRLSRRLFLVAIFLLMMALSVGREIGVNVKSGDDITSWCMAAMAFLGLAHTFKSGEMIRVGLLTERLAGRTKWLVELFALATAALFIGYFAWFAVDLTITSWRINDMSTGVLVVPLWLPQIGYAAGLIILFIAIVDELVRVVRGLKPTYEREPPKTAEEAIERAVSSGV